MILFTIVGLLLIFVVLFYTTVMAIFITFNPLGEGLFDGTSMQKLYGVIIWSIQLWVWYFYFTHFPITFMMK